MPWGALNPRHFVGQGLWRSSYSRNQLYFDPGCSLSLYMDFLATAIRLTGLEVNAS